MRIASLTWPFPFGVSLGWATTGAINPPAHAGSPRVFFLRGQTMIFSRGFGAICGRLRRAGVPTDDLRCVGDRWVRRLLSREHSEGRLNGPVVLVGHSCGGRYALFTAGQLQSLGIAIELILCVDVALPFDVPTNVKHAVHLYRTRRRIYPARALRPAPGCRASIENVDLDAPDSPIPPGRLNHLTITSSQAVQDWIVARVLEAIHPPQPA